MDSSNSFQKDPLKLIQSIFLNKVDRHSQEYITFLSNTHNLTQLQEHSEAQIIQTLTERISAGMPFTYAGSALIALISQIPPSAVFNREVFSRYCRDQTNLPPHIYKTSYEAYQNLVSTQENQVITLLGDSGSGKTFNSIHLLDHLITISSPNKELFNLLHNGIQALHIMSSVVKKHNLESTSAALITSVKFNDKFEAVGGEIQASLLDFSLPKAKKGRSYQLLHSVLTAEKPTLQRLGLSAARLSEPHSHALLDRDVWLKFNSCLRVIGVPQKEIDNLMDVVAVVLHLFDINWAKTHKWTPRNRFVVQKICKLLGTQEDHFISSFAIFNSKNETLKRIYDLSRTLYELAFKWLNAKINTKLQKLSKDNCKSISIIDVPGFSREKSLGSLSRNVSIEVFNYYTSNDYLNLLESLSSQQISFPFLQTPRCKKLIDLFLSPNGLVHCLSSTQKQYQASTKRIQGAISEPQGYFADIAQFTSETELKLNFSCGQVTYEFSSLRNEAAEHLSGELNYYFLKSCNSKLVQSALKYLSFSNPNFNPHTSPLPDKSVYAQKLSEKVNLMLQPLINTSPYVIYCIRADKSDLAHCALSIVRNSLIVPSLLWNWYGFKHWVALEDLAREVNTSELEDLKALLNKAFPEADFQIAGKYVLLKDKHLKKLNSILKTSFSTAQGSTDFGFCVYEEAPESSIQVTQPCVHRVSFKQLPNFTIESYISSSQLNESQNTIFMSSKKQRKKLARTFTNFKNLDYSNVLNEITKIQALCRGLIGRRKAYGLRKLNEKATVIQKVWKGYFVRRDLEPIWPLHKAALKIQQAWRNYLARFQAAVTIQRWFRKILLFKESVTEFRAYNFKHNGNYKYLPANQKYVAMTYTGRRAPRKQQESSPEYTFTPQISNHSRTLASKSTSKVPFHLRFQMQEKLRQEKLHALRQQEVQKEKSIATHSPRINSKAALRTNFLDRQHAFYMKSKIKRDNAQLQKQTEKDTECTFAPSIKTTFQKRTFDQTLNSLYNWQKHKERKLEEEAKAKEELQLSFMAPFAMSKNSMKFADEKKKKNLQNQHLQQKQGEANQAYWPVFS